MPHCWWWRRLGTPISATPAAIAVSVSDRMVATEALQPFDHRSRLVVASGCGASPGHGTHPRPRQASRRTSSTAATIVATAVYAQNSAKPFQAESVCGSEWIAVIASPALFGR